MKVASLPERSPPGELTGRQGRPSTATFDYCALGLLACGAFVILLVCLLVLPDGPSESDETVSWILAFGVALPAGLALVSRQTRSLSRAAPAAPARALAGGLAMLALAFLLRRLGAGDRLHHSLLALAAFGALAAPFIAAQIWRDPDDEADGVARSVSLVSFAFLLLIFVPGGGLRPSTLIPALALAAAALLALRVVGARRLSTRAAIGVDVAVCVILALVVVQLPDIRAFAPDVLLHHSFFLGPANDVLHGRAMLGTAWSQYGTGVIDVLALVFTVVPIGFGTFALIIIAVTVGQYLCTYAVLRLAGLGQALVVAIIAVAVVGNLFSPLEAYFVFPSATAIRFGPPYLLILFAVLGARFPAWARPARIALLATLAVAAAWSFETFVYTGAAFGALVLVEALCEGDHVVGRVLRGAGVGLGVSAAAVILLSLVTWVLSGHLDWRPYLEYLQLYSTDEFGQLPIEFFSAGPLMAAAIFVSAVVLLWLVRARPPALTPQMRAALAGFTGFAIASFSYYLGRSHPNNLLVLLVPVVVLAGLWLQVLLEAAATWWRTAVAALVLLALSMVAVAGWPSVEQKGRDTALGLALPGGRSLRQAVAELADNPYLEPAAPAGAAILATRLPPGVPALVLAGPNLTTEILIRSGRRNLPPISHPPEDDLIDSSPGRVRAASRRVPAGTILLTSGALDSPPGSVELDGIERAALAVLHRRFAFQLLERSPEGLELVRLVPRR
jgi:hypothetical protein